MKIYTSKQGLSLHACLKQIKDKLALKFKKEKKFSGRKNETEMFCEGFEFFSETRIKELFIEKDKERSKEYFLLYQWPIYIYTNDFNSRSQKKSFKLRKYIQFVTAISRINPII